MLSREQMRRFRAAAPFNVRLWKNGKIGLAFIYGRGLKVEMRYTESNAVCWQRFIAYDGVELDPKTSRANIPRTSRWALIIPTYLCATEYAVLPSTDPEEIEKMLELELPDIIPFKTKPWSWDYSVIDRRQDGWSRVLVNLCPLPIVDRHIKAAISLGIKPRVVTTSAIFYFSLLLEHKTLPMSGLACCFCLNDECMDFFVIENEQVVLMRGVFLQKGGPENCEIIELEMRRCLAMIKQKDIVGRTCVFYTINTGQWSVNLTKIAEKVIRGDVEEVQLTGTGNRGVSVKGGLSRRIFGEKLSCISERTCLNLLPGQMKERQRRSSRSRRAVIGLLRICLVICLLLACLKAGIWRTGRVIGRYEKRLAAISPEAEKLRFLEQQLSLIQTHLRGNISTLDIICELYKVLPEQVTVHYLAIEQNASIVIRAQAGLLSEAFDCIGLLEESRYFANVRQSYANQRQIETNVLIDFEITADIVGPPDESE
jgi:hypothetical protein